VELGKRYSGLRYPIYSNNGARCKQESLTLGDCSST